jgi:hypothetical protein
MKGSGTVTDDKADELIAAVNGLRAAILGLQQKPTLREKTEPAKRKPYQWRNRPPKPDQPTWPIGLRLRMTPRAVSEGLRKAWNVDHALYHGYDSKSGLIRVCSADGASGIVSQPLNFWEPA